uniref:Retrotransposon gag domain-containing protein n=1 Tax=Nicotiana tabacum TaxID=4097 RepID=A0A1S4C6W1_TOBAC|nr:PREDICTED: uncharacterized protein LOC107815573 [Nicotiana tabacum]
MHATDTKAVELAAYQLKDVANTWYETWEEYRGEDTDPATWKKFADVFLEHFLPIEVLEAKALEFERLRQNDMSVNEYYLKFVSLTNEIDRAEHLKIVLQTLQDHMLYAKFSKCEFWLKSVAFLGHFILGVGVKVDSQKIEAVKNWPRPTSVSDIRSFLGLAGYYRRFVEGFSSISSPLTRLT